MLLVVAVGGLSRSNSVGYKCELFTPYPSFQSSSKSQSTRGLGDAIVLSNGISELIKASNHTTIPSTVAIFPGCLCSLSTRTEKKIPYAQEARKKGFWCLLSPRLVTGQPVVGPKIKACQRCLSVSRVKGGLSYCSALLSFSFGIRNTRVLGTSPAKESAWRGSVIRSRSTDP